MPWRSKRQRRWGYAAAKRGEIPADMPHRWSEHTPDAKHLSESAPSKAVMHRRRRRGK